MLEERARLVGHRLSAPERRDWRLALSAAGVVALLLGYSLPMFTQRIVAARTSFSGGTVVDLSFPVLISGQHYAQASHPTSETLSDVSIRVEPVTQHGTSAWGWVVAVLGDGPTARQQVSLLLCLLLPLVAGLLVAWMIGRALWHSQGLPERWLPAVIDLSLLATPALLLAWLAQFDFAWSLFRMVPDALAPRAGFWLALVGAVAMAVGTLGLRHETRRPIINWWALVLAVGLGVWLLVRFRPYPYLEIWLFVSDGILVTLRIVITSFVFILIVSLLGGLGRISSNRVIHGLASLYVELVRGIPLLVQLLFIWFALPQVFDAVGNLLLSISPALEGPATWFSDLRLDPVAAAVLGLTICYGAYGSEIFRAGISSIHHGQMEAARSLGMSYVQAMRHVILPQAVRVILPPIGNEFVALLKDSTLVSVLAVSDLTRRGREYMARTFLSFDTWILVALCYLVLTLFSSRVVEAIEAKSSFK
jgi:polar amino acid transport system permease protein